MAGTLKDVVLGILSEPILQRIRFSITPQVAVGSRTFKAVREAIQSDKIRVLLQDLGRGDALFSPDDKTIFINTRSASSLVGNTFGSTTRAIIIHECIHVYNHLTNPALLLDDDEAAAYLSQSMYWLLSDPGRYRQWTTQQKHTPDGKIFAAAIRHIDDYGLLFGIRTQLARHDLIPLYQALSEHPLYPGVRVPFDI